jgi:hypothetical protein
MKPDALGQNPVFPKHSRTIPHGRISDIPRPEDAAIDQLLARIPRPIQTDQPSSDPGAFDAAYSAARAAGQQAFIWRGRQFPVELPAGRPALNREALVAEAKRMQRKGARP